MHLGVELALLELAFLQYDLAILPKDNLSIWAKTQPAIAGNQAAGKINMGPARLHPTDNARGAPEILRR